MYIWRCERRVFPRLARGASSSSSYSLSLAASAATVALVFCVLTTKSKSSVAMRWRSAGSSADDAFWAARRSAARALSSGHAAAADNVVAFVCDRLAIHRLASQLQSS